MSALIRFVSEFQKTHPKKTALALAILALKMFEKLSRQPKKLLDLAVLITGGGSGLGKLMAQRFVSAGSRVILWDINEKALEQVQQDLIASGGHDRVWIHRCDVSDEKDVYRVAALVKEQVGTLDILINNAGVVSGNWLTELSDNSIKRTLGVNVLSHFWTVRAFLPDMMKVNSGHIVSIASAAGLVGVSKLTDYCASKFAVVGFTEALRFELAHRQLTGIKTTCICPFYINTGMFYGVDVHPLLPMLEETYVVNRIMDSIQNNRVFLALPFLVELVPIFRLLPIWVFDAISSLLKINRSMDTFAGRSIEQKSRDRSLDSKSVANALPQPPIANPETNPNKNDRTNSSLFHNKNPTATVNDSSTVNS